MATKKTEKWFKGQADPRERAYTNPGSELEDVWAMRLTETGAEEFYISGQENIYEKVQVFKDEVKIANIMEKVLNTGDVSMLNQIKKEFVDITDMPGNLIEAKNRLDQAERSFNTLPIEIREAYNNNFTEYLADVGSEKWVKLMDPKPKTSEPEKEPAAEKGVEE